MKPDLTQQALTTAMPTVVQLGNVPPNHETEQTQVGHNYGQGQVEAT